MKILTISLVLLMAGCSNTKHKDEFTIVPVKPPHIWSDHKKLDLTPDICALKGESILKSLGFTAIVKNGTYIYGNFNDNRAAVKCVENGSGVFVYAMVAGPVVDIVERLRNEIIWKL